MVIIRSSNWTAPLAGCRYPGLQGRNLLGDQGFFPCTVAPPGGLESLEAGRTCHPGVQSGVWEKRAVGGFLRQLVYLFLAKTIPSILFCKISSLIKKRTMGMFRTRNIRGIRVKKPGQLISGRSLFPKGCAKKAGGAVHAAPPAFACVKRDGGIAPAVF